MLTRLPDSRSLFASVVGLLGTALVACSGTVEETPEELAAATVVGPITWDPKSQMKQIASTKGCDSWIPTWAADGNLYTEYGDCRPKGVPQKIGMGFGRISGSAGYSVTFAMVPTGDPLDWDDAPDGAGAEAIGDGPFSEKPAGMLYLDGRLWYWIRNINAGGTGIRLKYSDNYDSTNPQFTWVDWTIPEVGYSSFVQYGKAYAGGPADYVYAVVPMRSNTVGDVSNSAYDLIPAFTLIRGLRGSLGTESSWSFFCGTSSAPAWCPTSASATRILYKSGKKFTPRAGMSWNPGLRKFMLSLVYDPTPTTTDDSPRFYGGLMVLLSSQPWGPWTVVFNSGRVWPGGTSTTGCNSTRWGAGERADILPKYMSADGKTFYLFSSGGDCLSIARGVLP
jgi:hypothetical protein